MGINVQNENITDATIQMHIAFESAATRQRNYKKEPRNKAGLRTNEPRNVRTGRNRAKHRSSNKNGKGSGRHQRQITSKTPPVLTKNYIRTY